MSQTLTVLGIMVDHRAEVAPEMQEVITKHGTDIICRMGVPSPSKEKGLITLVVESDEKAVRNFMDELEEIPGLEVQSLRFEE